jgi:hypothetical protein
MPSTSIDSSANSLDTSEVAVAVSVAVAVAVAAAAAAAAAGLPADPQDDDAAELLATGLVAESSKATVVAAMLVTTEMDAAWAPSE